MEIKVNNNFFSLSWWKLNEQHANKTIGELQK